MDEKSTISIAGKYLGAVFGFIGKLLLYESLSCPTWTCCSTARSRRPSGSHLLRLTLPRFSSDPLDRVHIDERTGICVDDRVSCRPQNHKIEVEGGSIFKLALGCARAVGFHGVASCEGASIHSTSSGDRGNCERAGSDISFSVVHNEA